MKKKLLFIPILFAFVLSFVGNAQTVDTVKSIPNPCFEETFGQVGFVLAGGVQSVPKGWYILSQEFTGVPLLGSVKVALSKCAKDTAGYKGNAVKLTTDYFIVPDMAKGMMPEGTPDTMIVPGFLSVSSIDLMASMQSILALFSGGGAMTPESMSQLVQLLGNGVPLSNVTPRYLEGMYKYHQAFNEDSPSALAIATHYNPQTKQREIVSVASSDISLSGETMPSSNNFSPFSIPFTRITQDNALNADSLFVMFFSSLSQLGSVYMGEGNTTFKVGSTLWLDNIAVVDREDPIEIPTPDPYVVPEEPKASVDEVAQSKGNVFQIYPNPCLGKFEVKLPNGKANVNVYDMVGKKVLTKENCQSNEKIQLNSKGIYVVEAIVNGKRYTQKLIVK